MEQVKKDWELTRLKQLKEEEERKAELEEDEMLYAYTKSEVSNGDTRAGGGGGIRNSKKLKKKLKKSNNGGGSGKPTTAAAPVSLNNRNMRVRSATLVPLAPTSINVDRRPNNVNTRRSLNSRVAAAAVSAKVKSKSKATAAATYRPTSLLDSEVNKSMRKKLTSIDENSGTRCVNDRKKTREMIATAAAAAAASNSTAARKSDVELEARAGDYLGKSLRLKSRNPTTSPENNHEPNGHELDEDEDDENARLSELELRLKKKQQRLSKQLVKNAKKRLLNQETMFSGGSTGLKLNNNTLNSSSEDDDDDTNYEDKNDRDYRHASVAVGNEDEKRRRRRRKKAKTIKMLEQGGFDDDDDDDDFVKAVKVIKPKKEKKIKKLLLLAGEGDASAMEKLERKLKKKEKKAKVDEGGVPREKMKRGRKPKSLGATPTIAQTTKMLQQQLSTGDTSSGMFLNVRSDSQLFVMSTSERNKNSSPTTTTTTLKKSLSPQEPLSQRQVFTMQQPTSSQDYTPSMILQQHKMPQVQLLTKPSSFISSMTNAASAAATTGSFLPSTSSTTDYKPKILHLTPVLKTQPTTAGILQQQQLFSQQQPMMKTFIRPPPSIINNAAASTSGQTTYRPPITTITSLPMGAVRGTLPSVLTGIPQTRPGVVTYRAINPPASSTLAATTSSSSLASSSATSSSTAMARPAQMQPQVIINRLPSSAYQPFQHQPIQATTQGYFVPQQQSANQTNPPIQLQQNVVRKLPPITISGHLSTSPLLPQLSTSSSTLLQLQPPGQTTPQRASKAATTASPSKLNTISALINANAAAAKASTSMTALTAVGQSQSIMTVNPTGVGYVSNSAAVRASTSDTRLIQSDMLAQQPQQLDLALPQKSQLEQQNSLLNNLEQQTRLIHQYLNQSNSNN
jgi:hypothetical protein